MMKQLHLKTYGCVQGVGFRWHTQEKAQQLGLVGWVRNNPEGTVEIVAQGEEVMLKKLCDWCAQGPRYAQVERMEEEWYEVTESSFRDFNIV